MNNRQYTIRGISPAIDKALRIMAKRDGESLNSAAIKALQIGVGMQGRPALNHNLDKLFGVLDKKSAKELDDAVKDLRTIDASDWK